MTISSTSFSNQEQPDVANPEQPDVANPAQPDVANPAQPDVANVEQPETPHSEQPDTAQSEQSDMVQSERPETAHWEQLGVAQSEQPEIVQSEQSETPQSQQPETANSEQPNTAQTEQLETVHSKQPETPQSEHATLSPQYLTPEIQESKVDSKLTPINSNSISSEQGHDSALSNVKLSDSGDNLIATQHQSSVDTPIITGPLQKSKELCVETDESLCQPSALGDDPPHAVENRGVDTTPDPQKPLPCPQVTSAPSTENSRELEEITPDAPAQLAAGEALEKSSSDQERITPMCQQASSDQEQITPECQQASSDQEHIVPECEHASSDTAQSMSIQAPTLTVKKEVIDSAYDEAMSAATNSTYNNADDQDMDDFSLMVMGPYYFIGQSSFDISLISNSSLLSIMVVLPMSAVICKTIHLRSLD